MWSSTGGTERAGEWEVHKDVPGRTEQRNQETNILGLQILANNKSQLNIKNHIMNIYN